MREWRSHTVSHQPVWKMYISTVCVPNLSMRSYTSFFITSSLLIACLLKGKSISLCCGRVDVRKTCDVFRNKFRRGLEYIVK